MRFLPLAEPQMIVLFVLALLALTIWGAWRARKAAGSKRGRGRAVVAWVRRFLIGAALAVALAGPSVPAEEIALTSNIEIVFAVDRTGSMAAEDGPEGAPRLDAVRSDIVAILQATAGSRYSVLTWDADARVELPFTTDASAVRSFADTLHQEVTEFSAGSAGTRPVAALEEILSSAQEQRPENVRYLLVFTDGEATNIDVLGGDNPLGWADLVPFIDGGVVFGYGTEEGGPMRVFQPGGAGLGDYMTDPNSPGNPKNEEGEPLAISKIDEAGLERIAKELGVDLVLNPTEEEARVTGEGLIQGAHLIEDSRAYRNTFRYVVWIPALVAGLLLIWEFAADGAELARLRRSGAI